MKIRPMRLQDLTNVLEIEHEVFAEPWSRLSFEAELEKDYARCAVLQIGTSVVGFTICWEIVDELHIANVAVSPSHQRKGLAETLVCDALKRAAHCAVAVLEVRRSNHAARALYVKLGFKETGVRKNYYASEGEDAILMELPLPFVGNV